ncbi:BnaAnng12880D [Brassica napus]|uniref:BnaAnng12880D protein n=1 Tax=Brassica napus TaxID=3708 RepID=A0A078IUZ1_BRANA|nr:BnaAnng12880D [Brassica napus]
MARICWFSYQTLSADDLRERLRTWLKESKNLPSPLEIDEFRLEGLEDEINLLEERLTRDDQDIGFCHNDFQYGNVIRETNAITIIDYEYASYIGIHSIFPYPGTEKVH